MFNEKKRLRNKIEDLQRKLKHKRCAVESHDKEVRELNFKHKQEIDKLQWELEKSKDLLAQQKEKENDEIEHRVEKATAEAVAAQKIAESEAACYKAAIKEVGFDVKDAKELMTKMVEGLAKKTELNVISTNNGNN